MRKPSTLEYCDLRRHDAYNIIWHGGAHEIFYKYTRARAYIYNIVFRRPRLLPLLKNAQTPKPGGGNGFGRELFAALFVFIHFI